MPIKLVRCFFFSIFLLLPFFTDYAFAQQAGVSVSPALIEETLGPGIEKEYSVSLRNLNSSEQTFYLSVKNIVDVREGGVPVFANPDAERTGFELSDWIILPTTEITLGAGMTGRVPFSITVPNDAPPGGHFGSIFISVDPPEIQNSGAAVGYQVANIVAIRVAGDANDSAQIRQFSTAKFFHGSKDVDFSVRIENSGNVLVRPVGPLEIKNMLGQKVDSIVFNEQQNAVFPGRVREYSLNWVGQGTGFGRYEARLSAVYGIDGARKTISSTVSFWILPLNIILPAIGALAFVLFITFLSVKLYIRRTLAHLSSQSGRIIRRRRQRGVSATLLLLVVLLSVTAVFMMVLLLLFA